MIMDPRLGYCGACHSRPCACAAAPEPRPLCPRCQRQPCDCTTAVAPRMAHVETQEQLRRRIAVARLRLAAASLTFAASLYEQGCDEEAREKLRQVAMEIFVGPEDSR